eukprot:6061556-Amphidinium_carterae.1
MQSPRTRHSRRHSPTSGCGLAASLFESNVAHIQEYERVTTDATAVLDNLLLENLKLLMEPLVHNVPKPMRAIVSIDATPLWPTLAPRIEEEQSQGSTCFCQVVFPLQYAGSGCPEDQQCPDVCAKKGCVPDPSVELVLGIIKDVTEWEAVELAWG